MTTLFDLPFEEPTDSAGDDAGAAQGKPFDSAQGKPAVPAPPPEEPATRRIYTVAQLTARIRTLLEQQFFEIWVEGELSGCRVWNNGHMYFTLKGAGAQIKGV